MSLSEEQVLAIMAYADRQLAGDERARVEALLGATPEARELLLSFQASPVGDWLRDEAEAAADPRIADAVMAKLPHVSLAPVLSLRRSGAGKAVLATCFATLAAAAGVVFYLKLETPKPVAKAPPAAPASVPAAAPSAAVAGRETVGHGVTVEEIQSPDHDYSVYEIPASGAAASVKSSSVVIWVDEEPKPK